MQQGSSEDVTDRLVSALEKLMTRADRTHISPGRAPDLPRFDGATEEWLPFKAAYERATELYRLRPVDNLLRLQKCLSGEARKIVASLLHSAEDPTAIMKTLERQFGNPEVLVERLLKEAHELRSVDHTDGRELNKFASAVDNIRCVAKKLSDRVNKHSLVSTIVRKLSSSLFGQWLNYVGRSNQDELEALSRFLLEQAELAMEYTRPQPEVATSGRGASQRRAAPKKVYATVEAEEARPPRCLCCGEEHPTPKCGKIIGMSVNDRWSFAKDKGVCFKCLNSKHRKRECQAAKCTQCKSGHHRLLHSDKAPREEPSSSEAVLTLNTKRDRVLMRVCQIKVKGPRGEVTTYALCDEAASVSLIDDALARKIGASGPRSSLKMRGVNMEKTVSTRSVKIQVCGTNGDCHDIALRTVPRLQLSAQSLDKNVMRAKHLEGFEHLCYSRVTPQVLIGADHWHLIVTRELCAGRPTEPAVSRTLLGWVVHGVAARVTEPDSARVYHLNLEELVERHYKLEEVGTTRRVNSADQRAIEQFESTVKIEQNRYTVGLPWRHEGVRMPPNYENALRRLRSVEKKMDRDPTFAEEYTAQIDNLLEKAYAAKSRGDEDHSRVAWYLPHFAVTNPNKPGKVRLVFDAAATASGTSLNDHLLEGPDMLLSLPGVISRFRESRVAMTADIAEMFLQIKVREEDQPAQMFLWRGRDRQRPPTKYKMTSMIFGAKSSPFLAHSVRNHNAKRFEDTHPEAARAITQAHYMDDYLDSVDSIEGAIALAREVKQIHSYASFNLRGWQSNSAEVRRALGVDQDAVERAVEIGGIDGTEKTLGLRWNPSSDTLGFNTAMPRVAKEVLQGHRAITKREMLSAVMSLYDPLGLLSHFSIVARITLQNLWRRPSGWDEEIPETESTDFLKWCEGLKEVADLRIPRCHCPEWRRKKISAHVFCDASSQAYAAVMYWRLEGASGEVTISLAAAKARVAPLRPTSIPRLELQAAVLGARLAEAAQKEHRMKAEHTFFWTDSKTVLQWIRGDARRHDPFVAHRLGQIDEATDKQQWRWVPTKDNVADDATRHHCDKINYATRWFQGPAFLYAPEEEWPGEPRDITEEVAVHTVAVKEEQSDWLPDIRRFSSYQRLIYASAYVLVAAERFKRKKTELSLEHLTRATAAWMRRSQEDAFGAEIKALKRGEDMPRNTRLRNLAPTLGEDEVLRLGSRLQSSTLPEGMRRPPILDGRHPLTRLLVLQQHQRANHANNERVVNDVRQEYWVIHLRSAVKAVSRSCQRCRVRKTSPDVPVFGDLPEARWERPPRPFSYTGVDYFGPLTVTVGRRHEKRWVALFTCLSTRAVHLELVHSLSADSAVMALRRMAARRGWPRQVWSDNATCFRGADAELRAAYAKWTSELRNVGMLHGMEWRFIPPGAPHMGGCWERLVRSVKAALTATLKERHPKEETMATLLVEAEHCVNGRPLTHVPSDVDDPEALTPNHFLIGSSTGVPATGTVEEADRALWRKAQALADRFWIRWRREYLPTLAPRGKQTRNKNLKEGDLVLVIDNLLPRNVWVRGEVVRVFPGPDGGVRVAEVRTKGGVFRRPVRKLAVISTGSD